MAEICQGLGQHSQSDLALFLVPVRFAEGFCLAAVFQTPIIDCCCQQLASE